MNPKNRKWTTAEDSIVVAQVRKFPTNLTHAFKEAAKEIDRTASACAYHWYTKLSKDSSNACFITISGKHKSLNRKNGEGEKCSQSLFTKILKLLNIIK